MWSAVQRNTSEQLSLPTHVGLGFRSLKTHQAALSQVLNRLSVIGDIDLNNSDLPSREIRSELSKVRVSLSGKDEDGWSQLTIEKKFYLDTGLGCHESNAETVVCHVRVDSGYIGRIEIESSGDKLFKTQIKSRGYRNLIRLLKKSVSLGGTKKVVPYKRDKLIKKFV